MAESVLAIMRIEEEVIFRWVISYKQVSEVYLYEFQTTKQNRSQSVIVNTIFPRDLTGRYLEKSFYSEWSNSNFC